MITPEQRAALKEAVDSFLEEQRATAETFIGTAYSHGREGAADVLGADVVQDATDQDRIDSLVQDNFDLIVSVSDNWIDAVQALVGDGYLNGDSPVDIAKSLRGQFPGMDGNWGVIARDQVAKAQLEGRNTTYREIGSTKVEVTCAPDACEECTPFDESIVDVDDDDNRPQFHIQCACMDVPVPDDIDTSSEADLSDAADEADSGSHSSDR